MIKRLLFVFLTIPIFSFAQLTEDFESGDISSWTQSNTGRWAASTLTPINGDFSLKHVFDNPDAGSDQISCVLPFLDLTTKNASWRFRVKHGYAPSSSNNWVVFLATDANANQMYPGGVVNGYAIGINFTGSDDLLKLLKITNGIATVISTTTINWELQVGISSAPAIEIVRYIDGNWDIRFNKDGDFDDLVSIGSGIDITYATANYFGIYYKYSSAQDMKLWLDDFYFGEEVLDTIKPRISAVNAKTSTKMEVVFSEKMDSVSVRNKTNYSIDGGIGNPDSISLNSTDLKTVTLFYNEKFVNQQEYNITIQNCLDLKGNEIVDTSLVFIFEYIKPLGVDVISSNQLQVTFSKITDTQSAENTLNYYLDNESGNPQSAVVFAGDSTKLVLQFATDFINKTYYRLAIQSVADRNLDSMLIAELLFLNLVPEVNDIVINEIMADPTPEVNLPNSEYVEILNTTPFPIDITGWKIKMGTTEREIPTYILDSAAYVILCTTTAAADLSSYGNVLGVTSFPAITNSGATITLSRADSTVISSVSFTTQWYNDNTKIDGGWSIERIDPLNTCSGITNWTASVNENGGTPGTENSVFSNNIDTVAPRVLFVEVISANQLRLFFTEPLDSISAQTKTNYFVNNNITNPFSIVLNPNGKQVDLLFINSFLENTVHTLTIENISDGCNNVIQSTHIDFTYYLEQPYDVLINEIMADPDPAINLPVYEYIEIYNNTEFNVSLSDWKLIVGSTQRTIPFCIIGSGEYLILCSDVAYSFLKEYGKALIISGFPALTNSGQSITLKSKNGIVISSISYTDKWYKNLFKAEGGWSLEQIDPNNPCGGENNWTASVNVDGGTPGQQNSVMASNPDFTAPELLRITVIDNYSIRLFFNESLDSISAMELTNYIVDQGIGEPVSIIPAGPDYLSVALVFENSFISGNIYNLEILGGITDCSGNEIGTYNSARFAIPVNPEYNDIVINEILFNPRSEGYDFVELYNRSQKTIDLKNLRIAGYDDNKGDYTSIKTIADNGYLVFPGDYVVLTENPLVLQQHYYTSNERGFVNISSLPSFNDDLGRAILLDQNENIIDNMAYDKSMHFALLATVDGVSLERLNPDRPTDDKSNWHSASELVGFATPAYKNSQYKDVTESDDNIKVYPEVFSPDNDGFEDVLDIQLSFDNPGYTANIKIYDSRGRLIKYLANNLLLGTDNTISWDGLTDQNQKTPKGVYVIYFEIFDLKGNVKKYRKPVVVAERF